MNEIFKPKDRDYLRQLARDYPHLKKFIVIDLPARFPVKDSRTTCDSHLITKGETPCLRLLYPEEINVFISPAPDYKPYVLCRECLQREYQKVAGSGEYDIHLRHIPKEKRNDF